MSSVQRILFQFVPILSCAPYSVWREEAFSYLSLHESHTCCHNHKHLMCLKRSGDQMHLFISLSIKQSNLRLSLLRHSLLVSGAAWTFPSLTTRGSSGRTGLCRCLCFLLLCVFVCVLLFLVCFLPHLTCCSLPAFSPSPVFCPLWLLPLYIPIISCLSLLSLYLLRSQSLSEFVPVSVKLLRHLIASVCVTFIWCCVSVEVYVVFQCLHFSVFLPAPPINCLYFLSCI